MSTDAALAESTASLSLEQTNAAESTNAAAPAAAAPAVEADLDQPHPLQHQWTFFYNPPQKPSQNGEWHSNVKTVTEFATVEDFWRLFNALKSPSQLTIGSNYHMFKKGIAPEWEDVNNKNGGKWTLTIRRSADPQTARQVDDAWLHSLLALIGEQFGEDSHEICGIVVGPRAKETRIALWTRTGDDEDTAKRIGRYFKQNIQYDGPISYQLHDDSIKKQTSYRNEVVYKV